MTHSDSRPKQDISEHLDQAVQNLEDLRQAGHAPGEHDRQLDSLLGLLPGSAYRALADEHWTALFVSKGIEDLTGYPPDESTSRRLSYNDIMLSEDRSATREAVLTALREWGMYDVSTASGTRTARSAGSGPRPRGVPPGRVPPLHRGVAAGHRTEAVRGEAAGERAALAGPDRGAAAGLAPHAGRCLRLLQHAVDPTHRGARERPAGLAWLATLHPRGRGRRALGFAGHGCGSASWSARQKATTRMRAPSRARTFVGDAVGLHRGRGRPGHSRAMPSCCGALARDRSGGCAESLAARMSATRPADRSARGGGRRAPCGERGGVGRR